MNLQALNQPIAQHGERNRIRRLDEAPKKVESVIPTGSLLVDWACIGVGGIPLGSIVEVFGPEGGGKTTFAIHLLANSQRLFPKRSGFLVDAEHRFDPMYAKVIGWDPEANAFFQQPEYAEAALDAVTAMANTGEFALIVVDSVAALVPQKELEGESGDAVMGGQARLMSQAMRRLAGALRRNQTAAVFVNQIREKIGQMFGNPETTPTGRALKFYSDIRLDIRRKETLKSGSDLPHGIRSRARAVKNSLAAPYREAEFDIRFGKGIDRFADMVDAALAARILEKSGSWILLDGKKLGQGRDRAALALASDLDIAETVESRTVATFRKGPITTTEPQKPADD